jgi:MoaA/NifB/PqqE/SkfB family radical SAM enzyme
MLLGLWPDADCASDFSTTEALSVIDQLADAGLMVLAFSGGEPMLRRDWRELVGHAVSRGLSVNVGTNGSTVTEQRADDLKRLGVHSVTVSLDGHRPEVHDHFRQFRGLYDRTLTAIRRLVARELRVVVGFTPTRLNWQDGPGVVEVAERLGATTVNLSEYVPAGRGPLSLCSPTVSGASAGHCRAQLPPATRYRLERGGQGALGHDRVSRRLVPVMDPQLVGLVVAGGHSCHQHFG